MLRSLHWLLTCNLSVEEFICGERSSFPLIFCFCFIMVPPSGHNRDTQSRLKSRCKRNDYKEKMQRKKTECEIKCKSQKHMIIQHVPRITKGLYDLVWLAYKDKKIKKSMQTKQTNKQKTLIQTYQVINCMPPTFRGQVLFTYVKDKILIVSMNFFS